MRIDIATHKEYRFVKLDESKIKDILFLYKLCFGFVPTESEILSKHQNCNGEHKFIGFFAYTNEEMPAAFYGVFPQIIRNKNIDFLVAQSGDTMTHPDHQKKGLFVALAKHTFEYCKTIGISAIFGFPNQNSYPGFINKLNFQEGKQLKGLTFYENRLGYSRLLLKQKEFYNKIIVRWLRIISKPGNHFENSNASGNSAYVKHDLVYFKSKNKPNNLIININGVDVFLKINGNTLSIGDINSTDAQKIRSIVARLKRWCLLFGLRFLNFDATDGSALVETMKELRPLTFDSNRSIILYLETSVTFDSIEFLGCDIDVF